MGEQVQKAGVLQLFMQTIIHQKKKIMPVTSFPMSNRLDHTAVNF